MQMLRKLRPYLLVGGTLTVLLGGFWVWKTHQAASALASESRNFDDIPKDEYEKWMQDLGYTE